jgi:hypothetical protein
VPPEATRPPRRRPGRCASLRDRPSACPGHRRSSLVNRQPSAVGQREESPKRTSPRFQGIAAYAAHPKAAPGDRSRDTHHRVRTDRVDNTGKVTLRHGGRLYSISIGRTHTRTRVLILVQDLHIRIVNAATGELLRELTLNPTKRYQGTGRPPGPPPRK